MSGLETLLAAVAVSIDLAANKSTGTRADDQSGGAPAIVATAASDFPSKQPARDRTEDRAGCARSTSAMVVTATAVRIGIAVVVVVAVVIIAAIA